MKLIEQLYQQFLVSAGVCTDTRQDVKNKLFFALSGENFNGNRFAEQALTKGALLTVIDDPSCKKDDRFWLVDNVLDALQQLALFHRRQFDIPVIGITGTNGKTTTKELVTAVLASKYQTTATRGNLNNHIGVPLTLLQIDKQTEIAVIEMGANHPGEIKTLSELALPTHGIITNIGKAHLEGFGSYEGVKKTKRELYDFIESVNGTVIVNHDDTILMAFSKKINRFTYGTSHADIIGKIISQLPYLKIEISTDKNTFVINSKLYGSYNFPNILAAVATGTLFKVPDTNIKEAIENYVPQNNRSQQIKTKDNFLILDAYNANPVSLSKAIESFRDASFSNPFLIIGDMFELGQASPSEHQKIVDLLIKTAFDDVLLVGKDFFNTNHPFVAFKTTDEAEDYLKSHPVKGKNILVKGSRGMHLESLIQLL